MAKIETRPTTIYALKDPNTGAVRYVGKTVTPLRERLKGHLSDARVGRSSTHVMNWLRLLLRAGQKPVIEPLEVVPAGKDWEIRERYWIERGRALGWSLVNISLGGESGNGLPSSKNPHVKLTPQQVLEIRRRYVAGGISQQALAQEYQVSKGAVWYIVHGGSWAKDAGPVRSENLSRRLSDEDVRRLRESAGDRNSRDLANEWGLTPGYVWRILTGEVRASAGGPLRDREGVKGEKNPRALLAAADVLTIRILYAGGELSYSQLGARFGVSKMVIAHAVRGTTWTEVGGPVRGAASAKVSAIVQGKRRGNLMDTRAA
ncbi:MAG: hypothetical protein IT450_24175 [Phycisphaerales bacterium]|nr:hypothetical protein [Phycisphaerales bacterium]